MKTNSIIALLVLIFLTTALNAQELPPKHRGKHPTLQKDGKVVDENGTQLGYITKDGKVCDVTGKVLGIIASTGEVSTANTKAIIGVIQKDGSFKHKKGYVLSVKDGVLMHQSKAVGHVDKMYKYKNHACALHCFFNEDAEDAEEIDNAEETDDATE